ncbi:MAG TPA: gas vesicle protein GvpJ [Vulgatibacter sp.]
MAQVKQGGGGGGGSLAEVVDRILDKGIVVDAWVSVSLVGIEVISIRARAVIASVETYLKFAERIGETAPVAAPGGREAAPAEQQAEEAEAPTVV